MTITLLRPIEPCPGPGRPRADTSAGGRERAPRPGPPDNQIERLDDKGGEAGAVAVLQCVYIVSGRGGGGWGDCRATISNSESRAWASPPPLRPARLSDPARRLRPRPACAGLWWGQQNCTVTANSPPLAPQSDPSCMLYTQQEKN
jgi:hypothetical protein